MRRGRHTPVNDQDDYIANPALSKAFHAGTARLCVQASTKYTCTSYQPQVCKFS